jgi:hypothetical protein
MRFHNVLDWGKDPELLLRIAQVVENEGAGEGFLDVAMA